MNSLAEQVLPFRSSKYLEDFCEKMLGEGIAAPADILRASKEALETKLSTHAEFNFIEMADALSLRKAIDRTDKGMASEHAMGRTRSLSPPRRGRSRSRDDSRPRRRDFNCGRGGHGIRNNCRPHRGGGGRHFSRRPRRDKPVKPELWAAVEHNEYFLVQQLVTQGVDINEKYEGWTPFMKAAEEGNVDVMRLLLDKKADIEACNNKGRTALSFAAAPSMNGSDRRETPVAALRFLLESGASPKVKDRRGQTAKDYASRAKREESLAIFEEFGC